MATPHDALFAFTFGQPEHAAALLRSALPPALAAAIDWASLTRCDTKLGDGLRDGLAADLLFTADLAGRPAYLCIVLEHKSGDDPLTAFQLLRYVVRIWERHRQDQPASRHLPPVLPFVLHHGEAPWQSARSLRALVDVSGLPRPLAATILRHQPELTFVLDDLATQSEDELHARVDALMPKLALLCMQHLRGAPPTAAAAALERWFELLRALFAAPSGQDAFAAIVSYIARIADLEPCELQPLFARIHERAAMILDQNMRRFEREAMERGFADGRRKGRDEGQAEILHRQLQLRFGEIPPPLAARLDQAAPAELTLWAERLLTAGTIDDVFA